MKLYSIIFNKLSKNILAGFTLLPGLFIFPILLNAEDFVQSEALQTIVDLETELFPERNIELDYDALEKLNAESNRVTESPQVMVSKPLAIEKVAADNKFGLEVSFETGVAFDSNIYRAPIEAYLDYGRVCTPVGGDCFLGSDGNSYRQTNPIVYSSAFIPVQLKIENTKKIDDKNIIISQYDFRGSFYTNEKYTNADQILHQFNFGNQSNLSNQKNKKSILYTGLFLGYKKRLYVDRDTGENQQSGPSDLSERYTYNFVGVELKHNYQKGNIEFDSAIDFQSRDYKSTPASALEYDNVQLGVAGKLTWRILKRTKFHVAVKIYSLNYDKRSARDIDGKLFRSNPNREYLYSILSSGVRQRLSKAWLVYLDVDNKSRLDQFVGYDNYSKLRLKARLHYRMSNSFKIKFSASSWTRDYENAYAFDNATYGVSKSYNGTTVKLSSLYDFTETTKLNISYLQKNEDSSDLRYVYDRSIVNANLQWIF